MGAMRADHEERVALSGHDGALARHMTEQGATLRDIFGRDALREVGTLRLIAPLFRHVALPASAEPAERASQLSRFSTKGDA